MLIDIQKLMFSVVVVRPTPAFLVWLESALASRGRIFAQEYFPEEDGVWLIPSLGTFDSSAAIDAYLERLKPRIALAEIGKFGLSIEDVPKEFRADLVDRFFAFDVRDGAADASTLLRE